MLNHQLAERAWITGDAYTIDYLDREARDYVGDARLGSGALDAPDIAVDVVRRVWRFEPGHDDLVVDDCVLSRCRAVEKVHR